MTDAKQTLEDQLKYPGAKQAPWDTPAKAVPATPAPADGARTDGAGATSAGARALDEDAHAHTASDAAELEGDLDELVRTAAQRDEYLALAQRTQADFENYRKRVARDAAAAQERGVSTLAKEMLPALDNLDRALAAAASDDPLLEGVRLVRSELTGALARVGIESFDPVGEPFDPEVHEAVATAEQGPGGAPGGTVVEVYQAGYRLGASIIRPARVVVAA
jgi:molecular chaperone GrpE